MKRLVWLFLTLILALTALSCQRSRTGETAGAYKWEKEGFGGDFVITLREDGTYEYSTGCLSSYLGTGTWTEKDGLVTLTETGGYDDVYRFAVKEDALVFIAEGSGRFPSVSVEDGDVFAKIRVSKPGRAGI